MPSAIACFQIVLTDDEVRSIQHDEVAVAPSGGRIRTDLAVA